MVRTILITVLILLIGYTVAIRFVAKNKSINSAQSPNQENVIKAEQYLYGNTDTLKSVLVGSSLSARILTDSIRGIYNLALGSFGPLDGIKVVLMKKKIPHVVLIELNYVFRATDKNFQESVNSDLSYYSKLYMPVLRAENQPVGVLLSFIKKGSPKKTPVTLAMNNTESEPFFKTLLAKQVVMYNHPDTALMERSFKQLKEAVDEVEKAGSKVYFYEMPVSTPLLNLPQAKLVRNKFNTYFPNQKYIAVPDSMRNVYKTQDGIHLNKYSVSIFTKAFKNEVYKTYESN